jgi:hypothetical protein
MNRNRLQTGSVLVLLSTYALLALGCAAKKDLTKGPETDLVLEYREAGGRVLRYQMTNRFAQTLDIRGKKMEVRGEETREFSLRSGVSGGDDLEFEITIDAMEMKMSGLQDELARDLSTAIGKSFNMTISPLGEELELSGADTIMYALGPGEERSIKSQFEAFFPDLPERPIGLKDSWTTETTLTEEAGAGELTIALTTENRLVGFETLDGFECVKIEALFTGTLDGEGQEEGVPIITKAKIKGTGFWYFAYKEGIYVRDTSEGVAEGTVTLMGPEKMSISLKRDFTTEVRLIE